MNNVSYFSLIDNEIKDLEKIGEYLKDNQIYVAPNYEVIPYTTNIWYESPLNNEHYQNLIHKLTPISYLLEYYYLEKEDWCLEKGLSLFYLWYEEYENQNFKDIIFDEDVVATRLIVVCNLLALTQTLDLCILDDVFETVIIKQTDIVKQNLSKNNEGIINSISLYIASITLERYFQNARDETKNFALKNLKQQLDDVICSDGSFLGHSLEDAYILYHRLCQFYNIMEEGRLRGEVNNKINLLLAFIHAFLEPNGHLPPLGMSTYYKIPYKNLTCFKTPLLKHVKNLYLNKDVDLYYNNAFFQKGNYLITVNQEVTPYLKLIFYCAFHHVHKKQNDDLAFILYINNLLVFTDGGVYYYQNQHPLKQAIDSIYAHNTICIDHFPYSLQKNKVGRTGITNVVLKNKVSFCSGVSLLYNDILIKRDLLLIPHQTLFIIDEIISTDLHSFELIFNINPAIDLKKKKKIYFGFYNNELQFTLQPIFSTVALENHHDYGNKQNKKGHLCHDGFHIEKNHCIIYSGEAKSAFSVMQVNFSSYQEMGKVKASEHGVEIVIEHNQFTIVNDKYNKRLYLGKVYLEEIKNENLQLKKAMETFYKKEKINLHRR